MYAEYPAISGTTKRLNTITWQRDPRSRFKPIAPFLAVSAIHSGDDPLAICVQRLIFLIMHQINGELINAEVSQLA